jgi:5-(aminomethyl)-3-furanmethanol phosphate kinase
VLSVVKVGGGMARPGDDALRALCRAVGEAARTEAVLVVPGGGAFADVVRDHDRRFGLGDATAHRLAILAMDQFGVVLGELIPGAETTTRARDARAGRPAVLLPAALLLREDPLPASWEVTSDSIAAWVAGAAGAGRLVLVKDVDGLHAGWPPNGPPIARVGVDELAALRAAGRAAGVDAHFPAALREAGVDAWVVDGRDPGAVLALLRDGRATGTFIARA